MLFSTIKDQICINLLERVTLYRFGLAIEQQLGGYEPYRRVKAFGTMCRNSKVERISVLTR